MRSEGPLHSCPVWPRTPPSTPPEHDPHHHAAEAAQYQTAPAQYQAAHDDLHTDVADTHQNDTGEAEAPQNDTPDHTPAHTPDNLTDTMSGPPSRMDPSVTLTPLQHQL